MDEVTYSCTRCRRPINAPRSRVLALLAARKVNCQVCGSPLEFPQDVLLEFGASSTASPGGGTPRRADGECPVCARAVRGDPDFPERVLRCSYCGARMRLPLEGNGCRLPPLDGPAAPIDDVKRGLAYMPHGYMGELARDALLARAALGDVVPGETEMLTASLAALARWRPEDHPDAFMPCSEEQAAIIVPLLLFHGTIARPDRRNGVLELVFSLGTLSEPSDVAKTKFAVNVLSTVSLLTLGYGVFFHPHPGEDEDVQHALRVSLRRSEQGVVLGLSHQLDDREPQPASERELAAMREEVIAAAPRFAEYYALIAVYGARSQGSTIMMALPKAIERRIISLGEPLASRAPEIARRLKPSGAAVP
jgi:DNA-directed RNA polymerase subunit RPC12/RpoP